MGTGTESFEVINGPGPFSTGMARVLLSLFCLHKPLLLPAVSQLLDSVS